VNEPGAGLGLREEERRGWFYCITSAPYLQKPLPSTPITRDVTADVFHHCLGRYIGTNRPKGTNGFHQWDARRYGLYEFFKSNTVLLCHTPRASHHILAQSTEL
jgi:hypothetical protein